MNCGLRSLWLLTDNIQFKKSNKKLCSVKFDNKFVTKNKEFSKIWQFDELSFL